MRGRQCERECEREREIERGRTVLHASNAKLQNFSPRPSSPSSFFEVVGGSPVQHTSQPPTSLSLGATWQQCSVIVYKFPPLFLVLFWIWVHEITRGEGCVRMAHRDYGTNLVL